MKNLTTVSILLAALLAACSARIVDVNEKWLQGLSSSKKSQILRFLWLIDNGCYEKTGPSLTIESIYTYLPMHFPILPTCWFNGMNVMDFSNDLDRLLENASTRHEFFPKYCPKMRNAFPCLDPPKTPVRKCLDDDDFPILLGWIRTVSEAIETICKNDGEILFVEGVNFQVCIMKYLMTYSEECGKVISASTATMAIAKYGEAQCEELSKERDCMQRKLNECNVAGLVDVMDVQRAMLKNSPCRNVSST